MWLEPQQRSHMWCGSTTLSPWSSSALWLDGLSTVNRKWSTAAGSPVSSILGVSLIGSLISANSILRAQVEIKLHNGFLPQKLYKNIQWVQSIAEPSVPFDSNSHCEKNLTVFVGCLALGFLVSRMKYWCGRSCFRYRQDNMSRRGISPTCGGIAYKIN